MKFNLFRFLICFEFVILYFGFSSSISASVGMSISPPVTEILISPNKSVSTTLQLTNNGNDADVILTLHSLIPQGNQGHSTVNPNPLDPTSIPLVVKLAGADLGIPFKLSAGQTKAITVQLDAANLDEPTDVYFALLARPLGPDLANSVPTATAAISALFLTTITPTPSIPTNVALTPLDLPTIHDSATPLVFDIIAENKTSIMLLVQGTARLSSPNGTLLTESALEPKLILGNTTRQLSNFEFLFSDFALGPHALTIELTSLGGRVLTTSTQTIWILPLRYTLIALAATILLTVPIITKIRLTRRKHKD